MKKLTFSASVDGNRRMLKSLGSVDPRLKQIEGAAMKIGHRLSSVPRGLLRVRAAITDFKQLIRDAEA